MNLVRCENGHFYDGDKFIKCPHCSPESDDGEVTVAKRSEDIVMPTEHVEIEPISLADQVGQIVDEDDDVVTMRKYEQELGTEPVVGWLIGLNGSIFGQSFVLKAGRNFIGRSHEMDVVLSDDNAVSRNKHAIVLYEPKSKIFMAQPGESRELFYKNDKVVLNNEQLEKNDILLIGDTKLMFIPCCDEKFCWEDLKNE